MQVGQLEKLRAMAQLAYCNPFAPTRIQLERQVLGTDYVEEAPVAWSFTQQFATQQRVNIPRLTEVARQLTLQCQLDLADPKVEVTQQQLQDYVDVATYLLLYEHVVNISLPEMFQPKRIAKHWEKFLVAYQAYFQTIDCRQVDLAAAGHMFACLCQIRRAFQNIYLYILGQSLPAAQLRAAVWESIFTNHLRRYYQLLYKRLYLLPTLITGPSGTGKELIARAIGLSQYIAFDEKKLQFVEDDQRCFFPLNLSAMSETLIESELFGHRKGSFTGAITDREGWLHQCGVHGAIFLDEIGELAPTLQVKLLRVVQQRTYSKLGDTSEQTFSGKIVGATNRNMSQEIAAGRFREDLYFRLCPDRIHTPSLRQQLDHYPDDIVSLTSSIAYRLLGQECEDFVSDSVSWIQQNLGDEYPWRGNIRELEQCLSSLLIRGVYQPNYPQAVKEHSPSARIQAASSATTNAESSNAAETDLSWLAELRQGVLTADQLLQHYCHWVHGKTGSYESTARRLKVDRRTVKSKIQKLQQ